MTNTDETTAQTLTARATSAEAAYEAALKEMQDVVAEAGPLTNGRVFNQEFYFDHGVPVVEGELDDTVDDYEFVSKYDEPFSVVGGRAFYLPLPQFLELVTALTS